MSKNVIQTLRDHVSHAIGSFLFNEGFKSDGVTQHGILESVNLLSDYQEEGKLLFPEIILTNDFDVFKTIPNKELVVGEGELSVSEFKKAIKLCAPLAVDNWIIFIEIKNGKVKYGLVSSEMTETSLSLFNQTVGDLKVDYPGATIAYIRNMGRKTVELLGLKERVTVSLTLDEPVLGSYTEIQKISQAISSKCNDVNKSQVAKYFEKVINASLRVGHGSLICVIDSDPDKIKKLIEKEPNGTYLPESIDFQQLIVEAEEQSTNESSVNLRSFASLLKSMLTHDGITVFSNTGKLLGYHLLIGVYEKDGQINEGGSRSKAFLSMQNSNFFESCFFKSQDGNMKIWSLNE